ncbi:MAG: IS110 family transposase [Senegalia sp. (in: firmicutes)]
MNYKQNERLNQLTDETLIIGVDIAKEFHVARAQDIRGVEFRKSIKFNNSLQGYAEFENWIKEIKLAENKNHVIIGMEPTGHYWLNIARYLKDKEEFSVVTVNPMHVKKIKELDDNNQTKTDKKDAKIIAQLVKDARYSTPNLLEGNYEELRNAKNLRQVVVKDLNRTKNQIHNWLDKYFPEYKEAYVNWDSKSFIKIIKRYIFPSEIEKISPNEIYEMLPTKMRRGVGLNKIERLVAASKDSIGIKEGLVFAETEINYLLEKYESFLQKIEEIDNQVTEMCSNLDETKKIVKIKGIGTVTASGIIAELGDIRKYKSSKQMIKMAGLSLIENSSGKIKGTTTISRRGRKDLRRLLYQVILGMIRTNVAFKEMYNYYTKRNKNQLTGKQAIIALCRKLLRIIHTIILKDIDYDESKMMSAIQYPKEFLNTAA